MPTGPKDPASDHYGPYDPYPDSGLMDGAETDTMAAKVSIKPLDLKDAGTDSSGGIDPALKYGPTVNAPRIT